MTPQQLDILIERYFDGLTTTAEEKMLRAELADSRFDSPLAREARAVLSFSAVQPDARIAKKRSNGRRILLRVAAAVAVLMIAAVSVYRATSPADSDTSNCYAYVNGVRITDNNAVMQLMLSGIGQAADASDRTDSQAMSSLEELSRALNAL